MRKIKLALVWGTRPEVIKMLPLVKELENQKTYFDTVLISTGQHREMVEQVENLFHIKNDYHFDIMKSGQTLQYITSEVMSHVTNVLKKEKPDMLLVHGDTSTAMASAMAAFYCNIPIGHVEAGLRTWNINSPFPEEANRQIIDNLTTLYFAPTEVAKKNLENENHTDNIIITGNTAIDVLKYTLNTSYNDDAIRNIPKEDKMILVTMHRRENIGESMNQVSNALKRLIDENPNIHIVMPLHPNPLVQNHFKQELGTIDRIHLCKPFDVIEFHHIMQRSEFIMTDSGGIQEEAAGLKKPVLVLRNTSERMEGIEAGIARLVIPTESNIYQAASDLLHNQSSYQSMINKKNPYGDGNAAEKMLAEIQSFFNDQLTQKIAK